MNRPPSYLIKITGLVQGVGFRPFVFRLAHDQKVYGEVYNTSSGVEIIAQCQHQQLDTLLKALSDQAPSQASISSVTVAAHHLDTPYRDFTITSSRKGEMHAMALPDLRICDDCIQDINDPDNRRYRYPFTNCTNCGPRFSIMHDMPYDRRATSMSQFTMCGACDQEYHNPMDRRFHAQPNACSVCGPTLTLTNASGEGVKTSNAINKTVSLLQAGKIIAIKGIGGFHLACLATNEASVNTLRKRKKRRSKPFALMASSIAMIETYCHLSDHEQQLLTGASAPIVLLRKGIPSLPKALLPEAVAPLQQHLGFMLPYTPLHYLIMQSLNQPIILTSANKSQDPQIIDNDEALEALRFVADYFLLHNRTIVNRLDDSVVMRSAGSTRVIRRARGYAPTSLPLPPGFNQHAGLLAVGAELKNTVCLLRQSQAILSQHIGDLSTVKSYIDFQKTITLYQKFYDARTTHIAYDLHPEYLSSRYAEQYITQHAIAGTKVQHHHAHIAACLFEHGKPIDCNPVLGIVWDGLGLGEHNTLWGGEFLLANYQGFTRVAHFDNVPLLGGDSATNEPWRMAFAYLKTYQLDTHPMLPPSLFIDKPIKQLESLLTSKLPTLRTSAVGRLFDAVAYLLGICKDHITYEAQAAIELEQLAHTCKQRQAISGYNIELTNLSGIATVDTKNLWIGLLDDIAREKRETIAYKFHLSLADFLARTVIALNKKHDFSEVVLSGGVFNNRLLLDLIQDIFAKKRINCKLLIPSLTPLGDGGISLGQAAIVACRQNKSDV